MLFVSIFYMKLTITAAIALLLMNSCNHSQKNDHITATIPSSGKTNIRLLPLGKIDDRYVHEVLAQLKKAHHGIELLPAEPLPTFAWYAPRNRYRADSIIAWLQKKAAYNETYIALTTADISVTKGDIKDFGVMGLGYCPGRACVASLFRLKNKNNFYKVAIHELGHTAGLPHCPEKTCYLRDAEGGDPTANEIGFCKSCTAYLKNKGWNL